MMNDVIGKHDFAKFWARSMATFARAWSPEENGNSFLKAKMPVHYDGDSMIMDVEIIKKWEGQFSTEHD